MKFKNKDDFRKYCKKKLKKNSKHDKLKKNCITNEKLYRLIKNLKAENILFYLPLKHEIDVLRLVQRIRRERRYNIFVPFMEGVSFKMVKYRLPLYKKRFDIREPKNSFSKEKKIDLAIVPVLGVDGAFRRIGFGKGMYDRFFESLSYRPYIAFVESEFCFTKSYLGETYDIQADIYITPYKIINKREK